MLGIKYIKFDPTKYVIHYSGGKLRKEGRGLSFFYYAPSSSIAAIPFGSSDIQFIFNESTADFQNVTVQGQITYKVENPKQLADMLDFTVDANGYYKTDDLQKLTQRLINDAQTAAKAFIQSLDLKGTLQKAKAIEEKIYEGLSVSQTVKSLGVVPLTVNVIALKPAPEMARALETTTREALQQQADEAIYLRRNFAVEQEKKIKESELDTEIAVEQKKKQISEKKMETELMLQQNKQKLREQQLDADIKFEQGNQKLVAIRTENQRKEAETKGFVLETMLAPYKTIDWRVLMAIGKEGMSAEQNISLAFRELAENSSKIENLNISPELLDSLTRKPGK